MSNQVNYVRNRWIAVSILAVWGALLLNSPAKTGWITFGVFMGGATVWAWKECFSDTMSQTKEYGFSVFDLPFWIPVIALPALVIYVIVTSI